MGEGTFKMSAVQYIIIIYNLVEAFFALLFGFLAHSIALTGFGLDSVIESLDDFVMIQRMRRPGGKTETVLKSLKQKPMILLAILSFIFGSYVLIQSIKMFMYQDAPQPTLPGMLIPVFSMIFLPVLALSGFQKSYSLKTVVVFALKEIGPYMFFSLLLFLGLALNCGLKVWQADPAVGLITVFFLYKKSLECLLGRGSTLVSL